MQPVLIIGSAGNVGTGVSTAFQAAGYEVFPIDAAIGPALEDVSDEELAKLLTSIGLVVYVAENGNRDDYKLDRELQGHNNNRFHSFGKRCRRLCDRACPPIFYIGGSWTKRQWDDHYVVHSDSPNKGASPVPYEEAKISAEANARSVSEAHQLDIVFIDWISVVPNLAPNFTVHKMTEEALSSGRITFSPGEFGRPLLHSSDAGRALMMLHEARNGGGVRQTGAHFECCLMPGSFTPFSVFAEVVQDTVRAHLHARKSDVSIAEIELVPQKQTPDSLQAQCVSHTFESLGFSPDSSLVCEGLRATCLHSIHQLQPDVDG